MTSRLLLVLSVLIVLDSTARRMCASWHCRCPRDRLARHRLTYNLHTCLLNLNPKLLDGTRRWRQLSLLSLKVSCLPRIWSYLLMRTGRHSVYSLFAATHILSGHPVRSVRYLGRSSLPRISHCTFE